MTDVRPTRPSDLDAAIAIADWARVDRWRPGAHSLVAVRGDDVIGTAIGMPSPVHRRGLLFVAVRPDVRRHGVGSRLVYEVRSSVGVPFAVKAVPGSDVARFWLSLGAVRYQLCPPRPTWPGQPWSGGTVG